MVKILLLVSDIESKNKQKFTDLIAKNFKNGSSIEQGSLSNCRVEFLEEPEAYLNEKKISEFDLVVFRGVKSADRSLVSAIALILKSKGVKFIDSVYLDIGTSENKLASFAKLYINGIDLPKTIFTRKNDNKTFESIASKLSLPFLAKDLILQRGKGVFMIKKAEDFMNLSGNCLYQQLIPKVHEYRVLVLGDKVGVYEEKVAAENEFRNNVALGAKEIFLDKNTIDPQMLKMSLGAAKILGLQIAGVDAMQLGDGSFKLLEVNRGPGLTYDEKISPEFKEIAEYLENNA